MGALATAKTVPVQACWIECKRQLNAINPVVISLRAFLYCTVAVKLVGGGGPWVVTEPP